MQAECLQAYACLWPADNLVRNPQQIAAPLSQLLTIALIPSIGIPWAVDPESDRGNVRWTVQIKVQVQRSGN